ncbi:hypothetical protein FGIG_04315 [Fasciola gigantica]|uniref:Uncharacterized protein n=1 Tax=Fasciola gigantica TaxID=46835 RepID=A0A504YG31_FASGI|nr:hypothetical protein FGIG_04315 [Fasciola gigantica]
MKFEEIVDRFPKALVEPVRKMISQDVRDRPTSQLFSLLKVFNEPTVLSYESLITLDSRSLNQKKEFFNRFSKVIPDFEPVSSTNSPISPQSRPVQLDIEKYIIPELFVCLEPTTTKTIETVQNAINLLPNYLTEEQIKRLILPRLCEIFNRNTTTPKVGFMCKLSAAECDDHSSEAVVFLWRKLA